MKVKISYEGKTIEIDIPNEEFEKLFKEENKTGYERCDFKKDYWVITSKGDVCSFLEKNDLTDEEFYLFGNYFSDKKIAENMLRAQKLWNNIHRIAAELCKPIKMNEIKTIYTIAYNATKGLVFVQDRFDTRTFGAIWFDSIDNCKKVIDEYKEDLIWYFTEFKDRI